jgi:hypothetical protein
VLRGLERQERRIEQVRHERTPVWALTPYRAPEHARQLPLGPATPRQPRPLGPVGAFFLRTRRARRLAGLGRRRRDRLLRPGTRLNALTRDPE